MEDLCIDGIEGVRRRRRQRGDDEEEDAEELYQSFLRAADKNEEIMWNKFIDSESPDFFQVLSIAQDRNLGPGRWCLEPPRREKNKSDMPGWRLLGSARAMEQLALLASGDLRCDAGSKSDHDRGQ